jgi:hypothetical protein
MDTKELKILAEQLDNELKELIALDDEAGIILVYWKQDRSYVSWKYTFNGERFNFDHGRYVPIDLSVDALQVALNTFDGRRL